jgi:hypothetical protein
VGFGQCGDSEERKIFGPARNQTQILWLSSLNLIHCTNTLKHHYSYVGHFMSLADVSYFFLFIFGKKKYVRQTKL